MVQHLVSCRVQLVPTMMMMVSFPPHCLQNLVLMSQTNLRAAQVLNYSEIKHSERMVQVTHDYFKPIRVCSYAHAIICL